MKRNIKIAYFLSFAFHSWFWMGNWIFYYLLFGSYAGIALIDSGAILTSLLFEIPTGALADIFGKKKTLILAFLICGIGCVLMGMATSFWLLAWALWIPVCLGGAFYSGTMEALVYDSLKEVKEEESFNKVIGTINATRLWSMAICSVIGGFAYYYNPGLPYILNGIVCFVGLFACFFLVEPAIDTEKYSLMTFFKQNTVGIKTLWSSEYLKRLTIFLTVTGAFMTVVYQLLDDFLAVEYGFSPMTVSILFAVACLVAGFVSMNIHRLKVNFDQKYLLIGSMVFMGFVLALSPLVGMVMSGGLLLVRVILEVIYDNAASVAINEKTESSVRATTLSSLSLLRSIPYAVGGTFLGALIQNLGGARNFSLWFGLTLMVLTLILGMGIKKQKS